MNRRHYLGGEHLLPLWIHLPAIWSLGLAIGFLSGFVLTLLVTRMRYPIVLAILLPIVFSALWGYHLEYGLPFPDLLTFALLAFSFPFGFLWGSSKAVERWGLR